MQNGTIAAPATERVHSGKPCAEAVGEEAERPGAARVFLLVGGTLNRETDVIAKVRGLYDTADPVDAQQALTLAA